MRDGPTRTVPRPRGRSRRVGRACAALWGGVLALALLAPAASAAGSEPAQVGGAGAAAAGPTTLAFATLGASSPSVAEGEWLLFWVNASQPDCNASGPNLTLELRFGDGFQLSQPGPSVFSWCPTPGLRQLSFLYAYHELGRFTVEATVDWTGGPRVASNAVQVNVTAPPSSAADLARDWLVGLLVVLGGGAVAAYLWRRWAPPPPSLPLGQV